jgi:predicted transcriptional regulator
MKQLNRAKPRAYTSVMSLLAVMTEKGLLERNPKGRAFVYSAVVDEQKALGGLVNDLLGRAFDGSASLLIGHLLEESQPSATELNEIRRAIETYREKHGDEA